MQIDDFLDDFEQCVERAGLYKWAASDPRL